MLSRLGEQLPYRFTKQERRQAATGATDHSLSRLFAKSQCRQARAAIPRGSMSIAEAVQQRLDANPQAMRQRRRQSSIPFGRMKPAWGDTFLTKTIQK